MNRTMKDHHNTFDKDYKTDNIFFTRSIMTYTCIIIIIIIHNRRIIFYCPLEFEQ